MRQSLLLLLCFFATLSLAQTPLKVSLSDFRARDIGPAVMSGRISSLDVVHNDPRVMYVGAASGGVWKSVSAGATFRSVFDEHHFSIGDIAIDQNHPDTVWVGTGESWVRNSVSPGDGIFVTTNGGRSWTFKGLQESKHIAKVLIDPRDPATIYVAAQGDLFKDSEERGVYKSKDFGATWQRVLFVNGKTGCADLTMDPRNPNVLYASMWEHRREPHFFNSGGPGSGLYKSIDGGTTWTSLDTGGLPAKPWGRIAIEVAPSAPDTVYATIETGDKATKGLYRSYDAGKTWTMVNSDFNTVVRPFYFSRITIDPTNPQRVFKCGLNLTISDNGGESFRTVQSNIHSDFHDVWVNPSNPHQIIIGTDGGVYESYDNGYVFRMYMNLPVSQFYHVSVDNAVPFNVYGGLQDNGTWKGPSQYPGGIGSTAWNFMLGGDGFYAFPHPATDSIVYGESQGGNLSRIELKTGQSKLIKPMPGMDEPPYRFNWNSPIALSPTHPERLYYAAQFLFRSDDRGTSWQRISPDLTTNNKARQQQKKSGGLSPDNSSAENNTTIVCIAESPVNDQIIWAGTDDGYLQVTNDGGKTWRNTALSISGLPPFTWCTSVEPDHFDANTAYATFDGHMQGDYNRYVFKTSDLGRSWQSLVTEDVVGFAWVIRQDVEKANLLFLGTETGLFISLDGGTSWERFTNNFPRVPVRSIVIHPRDPAVVIGTHGRGIYILDNLHILRQVNPSVVEQDFVFLDPGTHIIPLSRSGGWFGGGGEFRGSNPSGNAFIAYHMKKRHTFGKMAIEVLDERGQLIQEIPAGKSAGLNIVPIVVRYPKPKAAPSNNRTALFGSILTPALGEGIYTVRVIKGKESFSTKLVLEEESAQYYLAEDRALQAKTLRELYMRTEQLAYIYEVASSIIAWTDTIKSKSKDKKWLKELESQTKGIRQWRDTLVALGGDGFVAEEEAIREEISNLYLYISMYPGRPNDGQLNTVNRLGLKMDEHQQTLNKYTTIFSNLSNAAVKSGLTPMAFPTFEAFKSGTSEDG